MSIEKISAVTLKVASMRTSVRFYKDVLGMEIIYGGEEGSFSSLRAQDGNAPILNLEQGHSVPGWGRMIFYVADVDAFWEYLRGKGSNPESPRDASWVSGISTCQIRMAMSCRLRVRSSSLPTRVVRLQYVHGGQCAITGRMRFSCLSIGQSMLSRRFWMGCIWDTL